MKGKTFIILGFGAAGGFIGGSAFTFNKMMKADKMREAFSSTVASKITNVLFGDGGSVGPTRSQSIHYRDFYSKSRRPSYHTVDRIIFDTKADAEKVLEQMQAILDDYGYVRIQDFYNLCGISSEYDREGDWGWTTLNNSEICKHRNGWFIYLPKIVPVV